MPGPAKHKPSGDEFGTYNRLVNSRRYSSLLRWKRSHRKKRSVSVAAITATGPISGVFFVLTGFTMASELVKMIIQYWLMTIAVDRLIWSYNQPAHGSGRTVKKMTESSALSRGPYALRQFFRTNNVMLPPHLCVALELLRASLRFRQFGHFILNFID